MKSSKKFRITGFIFLVVGITLIILGVAVFKVIPFDDPYFNEVPNMALLIPGCFIAFFSIPLLFIGFSPKIAKVGANLQSEMYDEAGADLERVMKKGADIAGPAIQTAVKNVKDGFKNETIYCKQCGNIIDKDSEFCKFCGTKQSLE